ncbi:hypothetical protein A4A49_25512 [Nicotiana attenuata]|uniref:Uncharacterized protein n=1 Tax=Nicotiana attenuata TaxID=49451 RepID=A0A1J6IV33_NICAT|nr:hypothetical protein A4A49_25512 [Nicotiana attenuata]
MAFNGVLVVSVAKFSAQIWQFLACLQDPISSQQLLDLVICFPLQRIGLCVWTFLCFPHNLYSYQRYSYAASSTSSSHHQDSDNSSISSSSNLGQNWVDFDLII